MDVFWNGERKNTQRWIPDVLVSTERMVKCEGQFLKLNQIPAWETTSTKVTVIWCRLTYFSAEYLCGSCLFLFFIGCHQLFICFDLPPDPFPTSSLFKPPFLFHLPLTKCPSSQLKLSPRLILLCTNPPHHGFSASYHVSSDRSLSSFPPLLIPFSSHGDVKSAALSSGPRTSTRLVKLCLLIKVLSHTAAFHSRARQITPSCVRLCACEYPACTARSSVCAHSRLHLLAANMRWQHVCEHMFTTQRCMCSCGPQAVST